MKKTKHIMAFSCLLCIFVGAFILSFISPSVAATFCVGTSAELQSALTTAGTNIQDDLIQIQQGTYYGNFIYAYTESFDVTIEGGYSDALCTVRDVDPANTVLDAGGSGPVLVFSAPGVNADFAMDGLTLQNGNVNVQGGGLYAVTNGTITLINNTITNNSANSSNGGGAYISSSSGTLTLTNNIISGNNSAGHGGGGYLSSFGTVTLTNNTISGNSNSQGFGGGIHFSSGTITLTDNTISNNSSKGLGGGIHFSSGTITLTNNTISGNNSDDHGGGGYLSSFGAITLTDNTISNNSSKGFGGGIHFSSGTITLTNNIISDNSASGVGGGGYFYSSSGTITLTNNTISGNSAKGSGGVLFSSLGTVTLTNNTISGNSASTDSAGGIRFSSANGTFNLVNNTINNNNANSFGGGVSLSLSDNDAISNIYNNIIWNNSAGSEGGDLYIENDGNNDYIPSAVNLFNNDFDQSADGTYIQRPFTIDSSNLDNADPLFVDPASDNYHLSEDSPCINAGNNNDPELQATDKDGNPRIIDGIVDMGAYEYQDLPPPSLTVVSPNGGEELTAGTTHEVTWTSVGDIDNVKIEYSVNNGTDWMEIVDSTENDGSYNWEVPNNPSEQCLLRISDVDSDLYDESDAVFSILPLWYVDRDIAVSGNGTSWAEAFKTFQEAIDAADDGDTIWVKQGTYFVTSTIDVDKSVFIYGGFNGTETNKSERNWRTNVTTVDGQNTVTCFYIPADAILDGFTIAHGHTSLGGGGGMYIERSSPVVINCTFFENSASINGGGAIHSWNASPTITNSLFLGNDGGSNGGGAIFNWDCPAVTVTNCTFSQNEGGSSGGGAIYNYISSATVTNCILWGDSAYLGSEVYNEGGTLTIRHCDLSGGMVGVVNAGGGTVNDDGTNLEVDPMFATAYHLQAVSDCIDAGTNSAPELPSIDIDGEARIQGTNCDIGADEFHDTDGDSMPDWWEAIYGLDDPDGDDDRDGLSHLKEYEVGTNPNDPDSDGDGVGDGAEVALGTDPNDPSDTPECPISYYVSPAGFDSNSCLFPGTPCKTIQHAIDVAYGTEICPVTIQVTAGTYTEHLVMDSWESPEGGWNSDFSQQWDFENNGLEPDDPAYATIIDGTDNGTCLKLENIEGVAVDGFIVQNGEGEFDEQDLYTYRGYGGGAYCANSSVHFKHTTFLENTADYGMGLYNLSSSVVISECVFRSNYYDGENTYGPGGVIYHVGGTLRISNSDFIENRGHYASSAIINESDWSEFVGCRFISNGGAEMETTALLNENTSALIINCIFEENSGIFGRGAAVLNYYSNVQIINCIFVRNVGELGGSALFNNNSSPEIINCTFVDNDPCFVDCNGVIYNGENSSPTITNSIFWQYAYWLTSRDAPFIVNDASSTATVTFSNIDQDGYEGINGNIRQDPMFYDTGWDDNGTPDDPRDDVWVGGNYHLQLNSPCINAGDNTALPSDITDLDNDGDKNEPISLDLDGEPRIIDDVVDMGVYEYVYQTPGDELAADFGTNGLWHYDGASWSILTTWNPDDDLAGWSGGMAVDFGGDGLWNHDGSLWSMLTGWNPGSGGLASWNGGLAVDFDSDGLWVYDGTAWSQKTSWNPGSGGLAGWNGGLAVDFNAEGLWSYDGSSWHKLSSWNPGSSGLAGWNGSLGVDFDADGLWSYNGSSWRKLTSWNPEGLAGWNGSLGVDFGANGLWSYDGSSWSRLTTWNPTGMSGWGGGLAVDFGANGLWNYDGTSWSKKTTWHCENMADVDLN